MRSLAGAVGDVCGALLVSLLPALGSSACATQCAQLGGLAPAWHPAHCPPASTSPTNLGSFVSNSEAILWLCEIVLLMLCTLKTKCFLLIINSYSVGIDSLQGH